MLETMRSSYKMKVKTYFNKLCFVLSSRSTFTPIVTSEAGDFDGVERSSLQPRVSWVDRALPLAQTAGELELVRGEDVADQVAQQPPAVLLGGVDGLVPLLVADEERIVLQQLLAALQSGDTATPVTNTARSLKWCPFRISRVSVLKDRPQRQFAALLPAGEEFGF